MRRSAIANKLLGLPRSHKRVIALAVDSALCVWTVWASLYLRLGEWTPITGNQWLLIVASLGLALPIFIRSGLYRSIFRHTGWLAMVAVVRACLIYGVAYALIFTFVGIDGVPRTVGLIQPVLLFLMIAASRALAHHVLGGNYRQLVEQEAARRMIIYGAGVSGRQVAAALTQSSEVEVVGFLDDDSSLHGATWHGLVIHDPAQIMDLVARYGVTDVLLAIPSATRRRRHEILDLLRPASLNVRTLPGLLDLAEGSLEISEIRPLEIEDLLGRDAVTPNRRLLEKNITGRVVLVTGGGGSIGSELCRQILQLRPSTLLIVDASEYALYEIHRELEDHRKGGDIDSIIIPMLASVHDEARIRAILRIFKPETIYHAAAYKHVPLVEHNALEGIKNNVFGTLTVAQLAIECGVKDFVLISTDKAVRPANIMGASKRLAEMILQALAVLHELPRFSMVRFGNVLGSSGSVVPLFRQQIDRGGPITITDPAVTRYFMTIPEAAQLVLQAGAMASRGDVFVLDMGEPIRVLDLARNMVELSGLKVRDELYPDGDIEIVTVGLRPGEKLYEELLIGENPMVTDHERIIRAREEFLGWDILSPKLEVLRQALADHDVQRGVDLLRQLVPQFSGEGAIVDWLATCPTSPGQDLKISADCGGTRSAKTKKTAAPASPTTRGRPRFGQQSPAN